MRQLNLNTIYFMILRHFYQSCLGVIMVVWLCLLGCFFK